MTDTTQAVLSTKSICLQLSNYQNFKDLHVNLSVTLKGINSTGTEWPLIWALTNCEMWTQCNVTLLVSRISAVSTCLSSGLRVIGLCVLLLLCERNMWHSHQSRPFESYLCFWTFMCSCLSFIYLSLPSLKCLKVHCHCHHGNYHFCDAEACSCLLFRHHCWLTACVCVCVCIEGFCVSFAVCVCLCVSNQCFSHVYIFPLRCCLQSILWRSLISVMNKLSLTARTALHMYINYHTNIPEQCDRLTSLSI